MNFIQSIFSRLYTLWVLIVFTVFMILLLPGILLPIMFGQRFGSVAYKFIMIWAWIFSKLTFIRYRVHGKEKIDRTKSYIYSSNHTSYLDAPGLALGVPTQFRPLAKKELKKIPVFGLIVRVVTVVVDRSSAESRRRSIDHLKSILAQGISILIFPEGTQNRTKEPLQPFYDGAFRIAIQTQTPIAPIIILNAGNLMAPSGMKVKPGRIDVIFADPIDVTGLTLQDLPELKQRTREVMLSHLVDTDIRVPVQ